MEVSFIFQWLLCQLGNWKRFLKNLSHFYGLIKINIAIKGGSELREHNKTSHSQYEKIAQLDNYPKNENHMYIIQANLSFFRNDTSS